MHLFSALGYGAYFERHWLTKPWDKAWVKAGITKNFVLFGALSSGNVLGDLERAF